MLNLKGQSGSWKGERLNLVFGTGDIKTDLENYKYLIINYLYHSIVIG